MRSLLLILILALMGPAAEAKKPRPVERWTVVWGPKAFTQFKPLKIPEIKAKAMETLRKVYAPWRIVFRESTKAPRLGNVLSVGHTTNIEYLKNLWIGRCTDIDEDNDGIERMYLPDYGVFTNILRASILIHHKEMKFTEAMLGRYVGTIMAHEIGHCLGMGHILLPSRTIMFPFADPRMVPSKWYWAHRDYMDRILGKRKKGQ